MSTPSATKQYIVNEIVNPTLPGQVTANTATLTFSPLAGSWTVHYYTVGKLFFNIWAENGGGAKIYFGSSGAGTTAQAHATMDQLASQLGQSVNTYYDSTCLGPNTLSFAGSTWSDNATTGNNREIVNAFLAN